MERDDSFELWDLRVEVIPGDRPMVCDHAEGSGFEVHGEKDGWLLLQDDIGDKGWCSGKLLWGYTDR